MMPHDQPWIRNVERTGLDWTPIGKARTRVLKSSGVTLGSTTANWLGRCNVQRVTDPGEKTIA